MGVNTSVYIATLCVVAVALLMAFKNYFNIKKPKKHNTEEEERMFNLSKIIREGAKTFMKTEYETIAPIAGVIAVLFSLFVEATSGLTFLLGVLMSSAAVFLGMNGAVYANYRVARRAFKSRSVGRTVWTALKGGSISGLAVQAFGMLGITVIYILQFELFKTAAVSGHGLITNFSCDANVIRCTSYGLGCSIIAMFNRVAGGEFTKSADISADMLNKLRHDFPEDDPRIPNVIADFIGDNVNDIAGNCSDLLESFVATLVASSLIANIVYSRNGDQYAELYNLTCLFPVIIATIGLIGCVIGIGVAMLRKESMGNNPAGELNRVTYISAGVAIFGSLIATYVMFSGKELYPAFKAGWISPWLPVLLGVLSGVVIGKITEIYTSTDYPFVKSLAEICPEGAAFLITLGDALGYRSCLLPIITIGGSMLVSFATCGLYGIAIAALGMLSFVGATVSIDAFGPISDNAGGIAEACHLDPEVRVITDMLDATGNTTAAIGKGFAIGSAAYATISLIYSYSGNFGEGFSMDLANPYVAVGGIVGAGLVAYFMSILMRDTIKNAHDLSEAGNKQLDEKPGILTNEDTPNYNEIIQIGTSNAIRKMVIPSLIAVFVPIPCFLLGFEFVGGMLFGATVLAIVGAIFMGNSGGAFDNAKKYIEEDRLKGYPKHSDAHKTAVVGDTTGDTRKDVVGVSLDIFIKMMSTVANTLAPVFYAMRFI